MIPEQVLSVANGQKVVSTPYDGYFATEGGDIISIFVRGSNQRRTDPNHARLLNQQTSSTGYKVVFIWRNGKNRVTRVHHIILESFVGPRIGNLEGCHSDGNRTNNRVDNLRWDTVKANHIDSVNHGTHHAPPPNKAHGEKNGSSRFTESDIRRIRELHKDGMSQSSIGKIFNAKQATISAIVLRRSWAWLE